MLRDHRGGVVDDLTSNTTGENLANDLLDFSPELLSNACAAATKRAVKASKRASVATGIQHAMAADDVFLFCFNLTSLLKHIQNLSKRNFFMRIRINFVYLK